MAAGASISTNFSFLFLSWEIFPFRVSYKPQLELRGSLIDGAWKLGREERELRKPDNAKLASGDGKTVRACVYLRRQESLKHAQAVSKECGISPREMEGGQQQQQQQQQYPTRVARPGWLFSCDRRREAFGAEHPLGN